MRYGWLKHLPADFTGERHVAIIKREPTNRPNIEWCEFEERMGPPPNSDEGSFCIYMEAGCECGLSGAFDSYRQYSLANPARFPI